MSAPLDHLVLRPRADAGGGGAPLLLLLHGFGANEDDLFGLAETFDSRFAVVSARAPLALGGSSYAWFPVDFTPEGPQHDTAAAERSRLRVIEFLDWCAANLGIAAGQTVVAGFSQGAILSASVALTRPDLAAGALLMSGRVLPEVAAKAAPREHLARVSYFIQHGTLDRTLPIHHGRQSRATLQGLGLEPDYAEYPMAHTISDESLAAAVAWTAARLKSPPRS